MNINNGHSSNFVCAGVDTFEAIFRRFLNSRNVGNHLNSDLLSVFLENTVNKYLLSFGSNLSYKTKKIANNHVEKFMKIVDTIKNSPFMKKTELYIDSGGFQVSMGALTVGNMIPFIDLYKQYLEQHVDLYDKAFTLDLPPGPGSSDIFDSYKEIENLNRISYQKLASIPQNVKDKLIYIHHFRTPSLYKTWSKFLWQENLADGYKNFATGGIVQNMASDITIPIIVYTLPLSSITKFALAKKIKTFKFHVLGGANFIDVFYHRLFAYHINKTHKLNMEITYDSSAIFKGLLIGRFIPVLKQNLDLIKMDIKSSCLHLQFDNCTIEDKIYIVINELCKQFNFKEINTKTEPIYSKESGTFTEIVALYLMLYIFFVYKQLEMLADIHVKRIYPMYQNGETSNFDNECLKITQSLNQGKMTSKQQAKTYSIFKSLNVLKDLDEQYNEHIITKFMSGDDLSLIRGSKTLKF